MNSQKYLPGRPTIAPPIFYPSGEYFGLMSELFGDLAAGGIAPELIGATLIAFASLLTQGVADVAWPNGKRCPAGISVYIIANSSLGKSLLQTLLSAPLEEIFTEIAELCEGKRQPIFLVEDASREALIESLIAWPCAGLFCDEADMIRRLFLAAATLAKLIDGTPLNHARISTGRVQLRGHRFCMCVSEQPDKFAEKIDRIGAKKGGVGLPNRMLMTNVTTSAIYGRARLHDTKLSEGVESAYRDRARKLLLKTVERAKSLPAERSLIRTEYQAAEFLKEIDDHAGLLSRPGGQFDFIAEYVNRHVERVLRLAAAMHIFEYGDEGEVSLDTVQRAHAIGKFHIENYAHLMYEPPKLSQAEEDSLILERAMWQIYTNHGVSQHLLRDMRSFSPNIGLTSPRLTRALAVLGGQGRVRVVRLNGKDVVELNTFRMPSLY